VDAIARKGSFAAAAEALDKVPSAITDVRKLEDDLDVLLFDRRGHKARLTELAKNCCCKAIAASGAATGKSVAAHRQGWEANSVS
jgi:DNA-binding transcriptional LysR family regulator